MSRMPRSSVGSARHSPSGYAPELGSTNRSEEEHQDRQKEKRYAVQNDAPEHRQDLRPEPTPLPLRADRTPIAPVTTNRTHNAATDRTLVRVTIVRHYRLWIPTPTLSPNSHTRIIPNQKPICQARPRKVLPQTIRRATAGLGGYMAAGCPTRFCPTRTSQARDTGIYRSLFPRFP